MNISTANISEKYEYLRSSQLCEKRAYSESLKNVFGNMYLLSFLLIWMPLLALMKMTGSVALKKSRHPTLASDFKTGGPIPFFQTDLLSSGSKSRQ